MSRSIRFEVVPMHAVPGYNNPSVANSAGKPVVLIADDEPIIVDTLSAILSLQGFHVLRGYGGPHALEMASQTAPDLLISDVFMPELNGPGLAAAVLTLAPACKLLFISGHATSAELIELHAAGHSASLLQKPVPPRELIGHAINLLSPLSSTPAAVLAPAVSAPQLLEAV